MFSLQKHKAFVKASATANQDRVTAGASMFSLQKHKAVVKASATANQDRVTARGVYVFTSKTQGCC